MGMIDRALACSGLNVSAPAWPPPSLSLALQGGGSFGAFTWGVLDRLLEEPGVNFDSNSGGQRRGGQCGALSLRNDRRRARRGKGAAQAILEANEQYRRVTAVLCPRCVRIPTKPATHSN